MSQLEAEANACFIASAPRYIRLLLARIEALEKALSDLMTWGVEYDDKRLGYIGVQVDRAAVEQAEAVLGKCKA